MLKTIEVEIDKSGRIHPLEPLSFIPSGRAYLTLLPATERTSQTRGSNSTAAKALELLVSSRFAQRPTASPDEVMQRIDELRNDWGGH